MKKLRTSGILLGGLAVLAAGTVSCGTTEAVDPGPQAPATAWQADGVLGEGEYADVVTQGNYEVRWRTDGDVVSIGIRARTTGWVAIGFQPGRTMQNADIIIGYVDGSGTALSDEFSTGSTGPHRPDTTLGGSDDLIAYGGSEDDGFTVIEFSRNLATGDEYDVDLAPGSNQIIWSYGTGDDTDRQHAARGYADITL